jgi:HEAT repeat protein
VQAAAAVALGALADTDADVRLAAASGLLVFQWRTPRPTLAPAQRALLVGALGDPDPRVRDRAFTVAGGVWPDDVLAEPTARDAIRATLKGVPAARGGAIALARHLPPDEAVALILPFAAGPDALLADVAGGAIEELGAGAWPGLRAALASQDGPARRGALAAVARAAERGLPRDEAAAAVAPLLGEADPAVRLAAADALWRLRSPAAVPALLQAVGDPDAGVRVKVFGALGGFGRGSNAAEVGAALVAGTRDASPAVREQAAQGLATLGPPYARWIEALAPLLDDPDAGVRAAAESTLDRKGDDGRAAVRAHAARVAATPTGHARELAQRLASKDEAERSAAIDALAHLGKDADALRAVVDMLLRGTPAAGEALHRMAAEADAARLLVPALDDPRPPTRFAAARALGALGHADAVPGLVHALDDPHRDVREAAAQSLGALGATARAALGPLLAASRGGSSAAATAAGAVGTTTPEDLEHVLSALADSAFPERGALLDGLGPVAPALAPRVVAALVARLDDVPAAASALGRLDPAAQRLAVPTLIERLGGPGALNAARALGAMGGFARDAGPALARLVAGPDDRVAAAAMEALLRLGPYARPHVGPIVARALAPGRLRGDAMTTLTLLGPISAEARAGLVRLGQEQEGYRLNVVIALQMLGRAAADCAAAFEAWTKDADEAVAMSAKDALAALRGPPRALDEAAKAAIAAAQRVEAAGPPEAAAKAWFELTDGSSVAQPAALERLKALGLAD